MAEQMMQETAGKAIPAGYKQTEVGVIPEDWDVFLIDNCAVKVGSGKTPTGGSSVYVDSGRPFVREGANKSYGTRAFTGNPLILND
ncbi:hypothetical protein KAM329D_06990 [Aeromonas caviae]|uniref:hypothetical protein n=1 Tax=Aeromonas caviae TaxID=648 RepID=UPI0018A52116|nr:hypothetical protein [Aeromonas caviae]BCM74684.1 hypothetical protein KAM329_012340 [Aeromonas caviae]GJC21718.1 hypothetical protein KAM329D_06990 [Aeromonas caviae]